MAGMSGEPHRVAPAEPLAGVLAEARRRAESDDLTGARSALEAGLAAAEADLGQFHPDLAYAMVDLATIARELGNLTEAQRQLGRAHRILIASVGRDHARTLAVESRLARVNLDLGDPTDDLDRHLVDVGARVLGGDSAAVRDARARLGVASPSSGGGTSAPAIDDRDEGPVVTASAWADAGEWSDPTGWSGSGAAGPAGTAPYSPVPGEPGVFGLRPPAPGATASPAPEENTPWSPPAATSSPAPERQAPSSSAPRDNEPWSSAPKGNPPWSSAAPIPADAPLYVPQEYDSGGWAAPASDETTYRQGWDEAARSEGPGRSPSWAPPGWPEPDEQPDWEAPRSRGRRWTLVLLSVAGIVALSAGTVVAMQALPPSATGVQPPRVVTVAPSAPPSTSANASPSAPPPTTRARTSAPVTTVASGQSAGVGAPPTRLRLTDDGTSVTVTWRDPSDGTVPFIVAGARSGDESHPMQSIPAGRTRSTIHGLNTRYDYCFTVAAVYSIDVVARSARVCTHRLSTADTP